MAGHNEHGAGPSTSTKKGILIQLRSYQIWKDDCTIGYIQSVTQLTQVKKYGLFECTELYTLPIELPGMYDTANTWWYVVVQFVEVVHYQLEGCEFYP